MNDADGFAEKAEWRRRMAALRDAVPPQERMSRSEALCRRVADEVLDPLRKRLGRPLKVCAYAAFRSEADPLPLVRRCWAAGDVVAAPRIAGSEMELRIVREPGDWRPGRWGVPEPDLRRTVRMPDEEAPDAVLVPGLAFDTQGGRLGYGGGYYDRLFAAMNARGFGSVCWIGFAWAVQISAEPIPALPHDLALDVLATETGVIWLNGEDH